MFTPTNNLQLLEYFLNRYCDNLISLMKPCSRDLMLKVVICV